MADPMQRSFETPLRDRLLDAAAAELRESGYDALTIRLVARRTGVSPATAYKVFASKEHLIGSVFLRFMQDLPAAPADDPRPVGERLAGLVQSLADTLVAEPELQAGLRASFLGNDPDTERVRISMAADFMQRFTAAAGDDLTPEATETVLLAFAGAMLMAGGGLISFDQVGPRVASIVALIQR